MSNMTSNSDTNFILFPINYIIEIVGNVASGKTTTAKRIAHISSFAYMDCDVYSKNPFLPLSVKNPDRWALTNDLQFAYTRSKKIPQLLKKMEEEPMVLDAGFNMGHFVYSKASFREGNMTEDEWHLLSNIHEKLLTHIPPIQATIFLDVPVEALMERIWKRGREHEQSYSRKYVSDLQKHVDAYKQDMIALKQRKIIATYKQLEKELVFHTKADTKIAKLISLL